MKSAEAIRLLRFLVEAEQAGETDKLHELLIGSELYGRDLTYDPKLDAIVRVNATRLRARLAEHYAAHPDAPLQIVLPKGSYIPRYERNVPQSLSEVETSPSPGMSLPPMSTPSPDASTAASLPAMTPALPVQSKVKLRLLYLALLILVSYGCWLSWIAWRGSTDGVSANGTSWAARSFSRLGGTQQFPAFSPDGRSVLFAWTRSGQEPTALYIQDVSSDVPRPLTGLSRAEARAAWSPDGKRLALVQLEAHGLKRIIIREIPGGRETEVARLSGYGPWLCDVPKVSWSADGQELYTTSEALPPNNLDLTVPERCNIVAINLATHATRTVLESPADTLGDLEPTVSPDGRLLAFLRMVSYGVVDVYLLNLRDHTIKRFTHDNREIMGLDWNLQSSELILASRGEDGAVRLSRRDINTGKMTLLTDGTAPAAFPAISPSGRQIAFTSYRSTADIRRVSRSNDVAVVSDQSLKASPQLSPDGRHLAFSSDRTGFAEIWLSDADGKNSVRLTYSNGTGAQRPSWFPDGKSILFECRDQQHGQICSIPTDGKSATARLTHWNSDQLLPSLSRDGKRLYYLSYRTGHKEAYRQTLPTGEPEQLTSGGAEKVMESWDGRSIYIETGNEGVGFFRVPAEHGLIETALLTQTNRTFLRALPGFQERSAWSAGPNGVIFCRRTGETNELISFDDLLPKPDLLYRTATPDEIETMSVASDGLSVVYSTRARRSGELDLLESGHRLQ